MAKEVNYKQINDLVQPLEQKYKEAIQILENEKAKSGNNHEEYCEEVYELFVLTNRVLTKINNSKTKTIVASRFVTTMSRFGRRAKATTAGSRGVTLKTDTVAVGKIIEKKQKALKELSYGLKSVADQMKSEALVVLANKLVNEKLTA